MARADLSFFLWEPKLQIGDQLLDRQHRELIKAINAFSSVINAVFLISKGPVNVSIFEPLHPLPFPRRRGVPGAVIIRFIIDHQVRLHNYHGRKTKFHQHRA